eukprot:1114478-Pleurochrysis_carterae.AAC.3
MKLPRGSSLIQLTRLALFGSFNGKKLGEEFQLNLPLPSATPFAQTTALAHSVCWQLALHRTQRHPTRAQELYPQLPLVEFVLSHGGARGARGTLLPVTSLTNSTGRAAGAGADATGAAAVLAGYCWLLLLVSPPNAAVIAAIRPSGLMIERQARSISKVTLHIIFKVINQTHRGRVVKVGFLKG